MNSDDEIITDLKVKSETSLRTAADYLSRLVSQDPDRAIRAARQLRGEGSLRLSAQSVRAAVLIDAGGDRQDRVAVTEGLKILRKLRRTAPEIPDFLYNLANGLSQLAKWETFRGPDWYIATKLERKEARYLYLEAVRTTKVRELRAKALINFGNELDCGFRWVEAYDSWVNAISEDAANGVAALSLARMLQRRIINRAHHPLSDTRAANYYAKLARLKSASIEEIAGSNAAKLAKSMRRDRSSWKPLQVHKIKNEYARFVATHRLALVGTVEGLDLRRKRWDDIHIPSLIEDVKSEPGVPPVFAMFNQLKADFCTARWLTYASTAAPTKDTSLYMDTLDYSLYGVGPSMLMLAQRAALDILDRVAVCANEYFSVGDKPNEIRFRSFWRENFGTGAWRKALYQELIGGNPGLIALGELAYDLSEGGVFSLKHTLRNVSTHRFTVLHDISETPSRISPAVNHYNIETFFDHTVDTLRIVRSAILYLLDTIAWHESHHRGEGMAIPLFVMPHHYIRGQE